MSEEQKRGSRKAGKLKVNSINFAPLDFEEVLESLLQVKPMPNEKTKNIDQKKKSKPKTEK